MSKSVCAVILLAVVSVMTAGCATVSRRPLETMAAGGEKEIVVAVMPAPGEQAAAVPAIDYTGERIVYAISPFGFAEYEDKGLVDLAGKKARLVTLRTRAMGLNDLERIYIDPENFFPLRVERDVALPLGKEYLEEEYSPEAATLDIRKYVGQELVKEYHFKAEGPIQNAVFMPFALRAIPKLELGQTFYVYFPKKFKITLVSIDEIKIPAGTFRAWHFVSKPRKFEVWISQDKDRIPLEIKSVGGGSSYVMAMKSRVMLKGANP